MAEEQQCQEGSSIQDRGCWWRVQCNARTDFDDGQVRHSSTWVRSACGVDRVTWLQRVTCRVADHRIAHEIFSPPQLCTTFRR